MNERCRRSRIENSRLNDNNVKDSAVFAANILVSKKYLCQKNKNWKKSVFSG